jgi:arginyl-tRNA synthetase
MYSEGMQRVMERLQQKNLLVDSENAKIVDLKPYRMTPAVVQKADGTTLYITRDIAAAWDRAEEYKFDNMYYVVGSQQDLHFQQLFKILDLSGFEWAKQCNHVNFGMVKGMSTRKGTVVFLEDILEEAKATMHTVMRQNEAKYAQLDNPDEIADIIGNSWWSIYLFGFHNLSLHTLLF